MPAQVTWRADNALVARVRLHADNHGVSMNEFISQVMRTVTDPAYAASASEQVRERLRAAGILAEHPADGAPPLDDDALERAQADATGATPLSQLVVDGR